MFLASQHGEHSQHHRYEFVRQRAVKEAARTIGLSGPVNAHMLWHSLAVHLIVLIMRHDFDVYVYEEETRALFDHQRAAEVFEASIFWIRPVLLLLETVEEFIAHWQIKRDHRRRGIVEVRE